MPPSSRVTGVPVWLIRLFRANLIAQVAIVVTGGLVRLTGSGLGCPTWPECVDGSLVPTARQEDSWHKLIEFGNRTLTFVLTALAVAAVVGVLMWARRRRAAGLPTDPGLAWLASVPLLGTVAQALLGGVTVLTGLHPGIVAAHLLLSMAVIAGCVVLVDRAHDPVGVARTPAVRRELLWFGNLLVALAAVVLALGTIVTGSGPNSGDADVTHRFGVDQRIAAWVHADVVLLLVGLIVGLVIITYLLEIPQQMRRRCWQLVAAVAAGGLVGYAQLFTGLPWLLVAVHMLLASLVWVAVIRLRLSMSRPVISLAPESPTIPAESRTAT